MRQWLIKQRTKPKHVRDNIAFGFASGAAVLAFAGWLLLLPKGEILQRDNVVDAEPEAFSTFFNQIKEQVATVRSSIQEVASSTKVTATSTGSVPLSASTSVLASPLTPTTTPEAVLYVVPRATTSSGTILTPESF